MAKPDGRLRDALAAVGARLTCARSDDDGRAEPVSRASASRRRLRWLTRFVHLVLWSSSCEPRSTACVRGSRSLRACGSCARGQQ